MAQYVLWLLLPVSVGAMVLLEPEDENELSQTARVLTKLGDRADRLYRDNDWDSPLVDTQDLSFLDSLPDLQVVHQAFENKDDPETVTLDVITNNQARYLLGTDSDINVLDTAGDPTGLQNSEYEEERTNDVSSPDAILFPRNKDIHSLVDETNEGGDSDSSMSMPVKNRLNVLYEQVDRLYNHLASQELAKNGDAARDLNNADADDYDDDDDEEDDEEEDEEGDGVYENDMDDDVLNLLNTDDEELADDESVSNDVGGPSQVTGSVYEDTAGGDFGRWSPLSDSYSPWNQPRRRVTRSASSSLRQRSRSRRGRQRSRDQRRTRELTRRGRISRPRKRNGSPRVDAKVEVLVVVENSIYRHFLASNQNNHQATLARIRRYYGIVFAMMDQRFQTIDHSKLSISVKISGIVIAENREDSSWMEKLVDWSTTREHGKASVNTDKALREFSLWIKHNYNKLPKFDHAMVFSGYRLTNTRGVSFGGKAYLNAVCDVESGNSVSIVADSGDFQCVKVAAHELAHSLGSVHDGDPGVEHCPPDGNYVMAPVAAHEPEKLKYAFYFSQCSIQMMRKFLRKKKAKCVRDEPTVFYSYDITRLPPGKVISPDQHCQLLFGKDSTFCQEPDVLKVMCGQLWCRDPNLGNACRTNSYLTALPGTKCGDGMSCHLGECVPDTATRQTSYSSTQLHRASVESSRSPPNYSSTSTSSSSRGVVAGSTQSKLTGGGGVLDNTIPTLPRSIIRGRVGKPRRRPNRTRTSRRRSRPKNKDRSRRKGRCKRNQPDVNVEYCRGLVTLNPGACKRRAIRNYCCRTCDFGR